MDRLVQDVRYAIRTLLHSPLFAITVIITLGLGIGANTAIFSFVDTMMIRPLPYPDPDHIVMVWQDLSAAGGPEQEWFTPPDYDDLERDSRTLSAVTPLLGWNPNLTGIAEAENLNGVAVTPAYFEIAGVLPAIGRGFNEADVAGGATDIVVLSHGLWQRAFGGEGDVLGKTIQLNGTPFTVVGVMPRDFEPPFANAEIWRPYSTSTFFANGCGRGCYVMQVMARVRPDVSLEQAEAEMMLIASGLIDAAPTQNEGLRLRLVTLHEQLVGPGRPVLMALLGAVGLLLLIACVNVANLLIARAAGREREIAVRTAIGASRSMLLRQLLTESLIVAAVGGGAGIILAFWGVDILVAMSPPVAPRLDQVGVDGRALAFALGLSALVGMLFGLVPALHLTRLDISETMKEAGGSRGGVSRRRMRSVLVAAEVAIALTLLVGAGLVVRSLVRLQAVDPGFRTEHAGAFQLVLPQARYGQSADANAFIDGLIDRMAARPGVAAIGAVSILPLTGDNSDVGFVVDGRPAPVSSADQPAADYRSATVGYLAAAGMRLLRGRWIGPTDRLDAPAVIVINEAMAARYWPGEDAIGKRISYRGPAGPWSTVVGITADVHERGLDQAPRPTMYMSHLQLPSRQMTFVIRADNDVTAELAAARAEVKALDPDLPVSAQTTLEALVSQSIATPRLVVAFFGFFALVALLLAAVGIYGVTAHAVTQRSQEIGIRMALGADGRQVVAWIVRQAMFVTVAGLVIGVAAALILSRTLAGLLFDLSPSDPATFATIVVLITAVSLIASWAPARRAAALAPMKTLRRE